jgi:hypothetical protein
VRGELERVLVDEHSPGRREVGQAGSHVDSVPDHSETGLLVGRSHHDLARVHARVHFGEGLLRLVRVQTAHVVAQRDRGAHGALGVVLMDERDTKHRHKPVPHHLRNGAAELLDDELEGGHRRAEEAVDLLGIQRRRQARVPGQIGEQNADVLALAARRDRTR